MDGSGNAQPVAVLHADRQVPQEGTVALSSSAVATRPHSVSALSATLK